MAAKCVWKICFSVCLSLNFVTTSVVRSRKLFPLDLIHFNDFHDRFEETSVQFPICSSNDTNCIGGFPRLFHEIKELHSQKPQALILNAGDSFQGTYWYTLLKWNVTQHFMNMIPHDAYTLGNHEFDNGIEGLTPYLKALKAPTVVANMDTTNEPDLKDLYQPYVIVKRGEKLIGIIGVITPDTKKTSKTGRVEFTDPIVAVRETAKKLTEQGVTIIIVLSHCGIKVDQQIAKEAGENIDIIVGGHTHSLLWNSEYSPSQEQITGPYPMMVGTKNRRGHVVRNRQILIVTASSYSKYIGNITAYFDDEGEIVTYDGGPIFLDRSIPEDPTIKELMRPYTEYLHMIVNQEVATSEIDLPDKPCGSGECIIGDIIADSMLDAANAMEQSDLPTVAFIPRNMIRGGISKGAITRGSIINTLPFGNKVVSMTLKGKYLFEALNKGLESVWTAKPFTGPFLPQIADMKLIIDGKKRAVESVHIKHKDGYKLLKSDQIYRLVTVDFLAYGGNGFTMLKENNADLKTVGVDFEILEKYLNKITPIKDHAQDRLLVIN